MTKPMTDEELAKEVEDWVENTTLPGSELFVDRLARAYLCLRAEVERLKEHIKKVQGDWAASEKRSLAHQAKLVAHESRCTVDGDDSGPDGCYTVNERQLDCS